MARAVLDANVLISAVISPLGAPALIVDAWRRGELEMVVSERLLTEVAGVLRRPRLRRWVNPDEIDVLMAYFRGRGLLHEDPVMPARLASDPSDDYLIALAQASGADVLVTGDEALRQAQVPGVHLMRPREFVERFL